MQVRIGCPGTVQYQYVAVWAEQKNMVEWLCHGNNALRMQGLLTAATDETSSPATITVALAFARLCCITDN